MTIQFDDKGKIFTDVITKDPTKVILQTQNHLVEGTVFVKRGERLIDELNNSEKFLAVTDAVVSTHQGKPLYRCEFLTVNVDQIIWLLPNDEIVTGLNDSGE